MGVGRLNYLCRHASRLPGSRAVGNRLQVPQRIHLVVIKAIHIRDTRTLSANIDGSPLPIGASIGPVGSSWSSGWPTSSLAGYVWMHAEYDQDGGILHWFDAPNPVVCP